MPYEQDNDPELSSVIIINGGIQKHNFYDSGDVDWVKFYGIEGEDYEIEVNNMGTNSDVAIELYRADNLTKPLEEINDGETGEYELLSWLCPGNDIYYLKITNVAGSFGKNTEYELTVSYPEAPPDKRMTGIVSNVCSGELIKDVRIHSTSGNGSAISMENGNYEMLFVSENGTYDVTTETDDYEIFTDSGSLESGDVVIQNITMTPIIENDDLSLLHAIASLKIVINMELENQYIDRVPDIDCDGKIGLPEVIYILEKLATDIDT